MGRGKLRMSLIFMVYVNELSLDRGSTRREQVGVEERTYAWHQGIIGDSLAWWITMHGQESRCLASEPKFCLFLGFFFFLMALVKLLVSLCLCFPISKY